MDRGYLTPMLWTALLSISLAAPPDIESLPPAATTLSCTGMSDPPTGEDLSCTPDASGDTTEAKRSRRAEAQPQPQAQGLPTGREAVLVSFARVIERGAPVYNSGDHGRCAAMYQTAIESALLLAHEDLSVLDQQVLQQALMLAASQGEQEAAWTFRHAMDAILAQ